MDASVGPFLLTVQMNVAPEQEDAFNSWYYHHVPKLLEIPGWLWGRRYVSIKGPRKYLAVYSVESMDAMALVSSADDKDKHPLAIAERSLFDAIPDKTDVMSNVYEQISGAGLGAPLLRDDHVINLVMADVIDPAKEAEWNAWYDHSHVPNLLRVPGYLAAGRFRVKTDPRFGARRMGPKYLAMYEWAGEHCVDTLTNPDKMLPEAKAELAEWHAYGRPLADNVITNAYRPIAKYVSYR